MYRTIFGQDSYSFFNTISVVITAISCFFLIKLKTKSMGLFSKYALLKISKKSLKAENFFKYILAFIEVFILGLISALSVSFNAPFGDLVGTGLNYYGGLYGFLIIAVIFSLVIIANPLEQMDVATLLLPGRLFFLKVACFCNGCCWGIPWKYGPYNHHYAHPGNQVPVQAIEALWAILILVFLLIYRKKAKPGTLFPMYMILYSGTRFFSEFFTAAYPDLIGPFNMYQILCVFAVIIGLILLYIVNSFGERITLFFDTKYEKLCTKQVQKEKDIALRLAEEEAKESERKEKVRLAREKAKARRGK